jgi:hypothetical protein
MMVSTVCTQSRKRKVEGGDYRPNGSREIMTMQYFWMV